MEPPLNDQNRALIFKLVNQILLFHGLNPLILDHLDLPLNLESRVVTHFENGPDENLKSQHVSQDYDG